VAMTAGITTLDVLERQDGWRALESLGAQFERIIRPVLERAPFPLHLVRIGSLAWLSLHAGGAPRSAAPLPQEATERFAKLFHGLLAHGIYLPPSPYEVCFLSLAHRQEHIEEFATALESVLAA
jgi:glutamate-1-semialdehyde 2,1-aminomutase